MKIKGSAPAEDPNSETNPPKNLAVFFAVDGVCHAMLDDAWPCCEVQLHF